MNTLILFALAALPALTESGKIRNQIVDRVEQSCREDSCDDDRKNIVDIGIRNIHEPDICDTVMKGLKKSFRAKILRTHRVKYVVESRVCGTQYVIDVENPQIVVVIL